MGQKANPRRLGEKEATAIGRNLRVSPYKLNTVAKLIRGLPAGVAMDRLAFLRKHAAHDVRKVLSSAISNAENNHGLDVDALTVAEAYTGKALTLKRWRARARGRAAPILHPFSRVTIVVREETAPPVDASEAKKPARKKAAEKEA